VRDKEAANFVHWGATSQDVIDTALMLELRAAIDALIVDLDAAIKGFTTLAGRHRRTLSVARTLMQHALPMPFGLKLAGYAAALGRSRERLTRLRRDALALQFGGAAGTLAALGERGMAVSERLAALLDLPLPDAPWHTHRDRITEIAACFGILVGTCGKIARDVTLMMQNEVGEAFEPVAPGRVGSSTLPHKRNPLGAATALSAAAVAPNLVATLLAAQVQEHERAPGSWQTDWMIFPTLALVTSGAVNAVVEIALGLEVDVEKLRANVEMSDGQIMAESVSFALSEKMGRAEANALVRELSQKAAKGDSQFRELLLQDPRVKSHLSVLGIEKLFIPLPYQGSAQTFIDRLVVASQMRAPRRPEMRTEARPAETKPPTAPQSPSASQIELAVPASPTTTNNNRMAATPLAALLPIAEAAAASSELKVSEADRIEPPAPETKKEDGPGAFMEVLSRLKTDVESDPHDQNKHKNS
jgi:3-carboxy-cis,cis-muconate cycloisomerase